MTLLAPARLWTNAHDRACRVIPGPGRWHRCSHCGTRWRPIGRYVRPTTQGYRCPGCLSTHRGLRRSLGGWTAQPAPHTPS